MLFYLIIIADLFDLSFGQCNSKCLNCIYFSCLQCPPNYGLYSIIIDLCVKCPIGSFSDGFSYCFDCPTNCLSCNSSGQCTECYTNYSLNNNICVLNQQNICSDQNCQTCINNICSACKDGSYKVVNGKCVTCDQNCKTCSQGVCSDCNQNYSLSNNLCTLVSVNITNQTNNSGVQNTTTTSVTNNNITNITYVTGNNTNNTNITNNGNITNNNNSTIPESVQQSNNQTNNSQPSNNQSQNNGSGQNQSLQNDSNSGGGQNSSSGGGQNSSSGDSQNTTKQSQNQTQIPEIDKKQNITNQTNETQTNSSQANEGMSGTQIMITIIVCIVVLAIVISFLGYQCIKRRKSDIVAPSGQNVSKLEEKKNSLVIQDINDDEKQSIQKGETKLHYL